MWPKLKSLFQSMFNVEKHERLKVLFLSLAFFLIIGAYTVAKEIKDSIFISVVGRDYVPYAKVLTMLVFVPAILAYSKLVDSIRRYQLLCLYASFFGLFGFIFTFFLGHPIIGIANTNTSPFRLFGWLFYFFVEGYSPFVVSVFWAFANSITSPDEAKKNYGWIVSASKIGGMVSAGLAWLLFSYHVSGMNYSKDVFNHQIVLTIASAMLICVPFIILMLMKRVPGRYLHGYEAAYQVEKQKGKEGRRIQTGVFAGLFLLLKHPYVLGIFGMSFFYEIVYTVLSYMRLTIAQTNFGETISGVSSFLFQIAFIAHSVGLVISLLGTRTLLQWLGERICLLLIPLLSGFVLLYFMMYMSAYALMIAFVALRAINYAFSWPVRESLYIPTIKEIKFKSKSWIDAFGSKFAKTGGSTFNILISHVGQRLIMPVHSIFFAGVISIWFLVAFLLGKRFEKAIARNEVIGDMEGAEKTQISEL